MIDDHRVFSREIIERAMRANPSPVTGTTTYKDPDTGGEVDYTTHADGSVTVTAVRERIRTHGERTPDGCLEMDFMGYSKRKQ